MQGHYYGRGPGRGRIIIANLGSERSYGRTKKRFDSQITFFLLRKKVYGTQAETKLEPFVQISFMAKTPALAIPYLSLALNLFFINLTPMVNLSFMAIP